MCCVFVWSFFHSEERQPASQQKTLKVVVMMTMLLSSLVKITNKTSLTKFIKISTHINTYIHTYSAIHPSMHNIIIQSWPNNLCCSPSWCCCCCFYPLCLEFSFIHIYTTILRLNFVYFLEFWRPFFQFSSCSRHWRFCKMCSCVVVVAGFIVMVLYSIPFRCVALGIYCISWDLNKKGSNWIFQN